MASALDTLPPPAAANPLDALPPPVDLYPGLSNIPGFDYVKPFLDVAAGAGGDAAQHVVNVYDLVRRIPPLTPILPDSKDVHAAIKAATPDTTSAHIGQFLEGLTEYMLPAAKAAELLPAAKAATALSVATPGAPLLARALAQAGVGAGVTAAQTGGDPGSMALGAALGAGGEAAGDIAKGARDLLANRAPTLANFSEAFGGATPTQKARITNALGTLAKDGIVPPETVHDTQDIVKGKLADLEDAYRNLDPAIKARTQPAQNVVRRLENLQGQFMRRGVVTDQTAFNTLQNQIDTVKDIAAQNGGRLELDDLVHMKQLANGRTNWQSPLVEQTLWNNIGDAYRGASDALAPEVTPINRDYQIYKDLERIIDQNIARGKGVAPTGLDLLLKQANISNIGTTAGAALGYKLGGPVGAAFGGVAGGTAGAKLGAVAARAIQNAVDSGALARMTPIQRNLLQTMARIGDNAAVLKLLGVSATEESAVGR
jgi:hypothetical protein